LKKINLGIEGWGTEGSYTKLSKEAYEFWHNAVEEHGEECLISYMEDGGEFEYSDYFATLPEYARFLKDEKSGSERDWNDNCNLIEIASGLNYGNSETYLEIDIEDEKTGEASKEYLATEFKAKDKEYSIPSDIEYIAHFRSDYKGSFSSTIEVKGEFKPEKLKIITTSYPIEGKVIEAIEYDGVEFDIEFDYSDSKGCVSSVFTREDIE